MYQDYNLRDGNVFKKFTRMLETCRGPLAWRLHAAPWQCGRGAVLHPQRGGWVRDTHSTHLYRIAASTPRPRWGSPDLAAPTRVILIGQRAAARNVIQTCGTRCAMTSTPVATFTIFFYFTLFPLKDAGKYFFPTIWKNIKDLCI